MELQYKLAPSLLAADFSCLGDEIKKLEEAGADYVHIDVMDGMFVPNISIGLPVIRSIRKCSKMFFDVHLMIEDPIRYIDRFADAGADGITVHAEACEDIDLALNAIKFAGCRPAVCISPDTDVEVIYPYLEKVYMVLIMSVYPGYGGQKLIPDTLEKARKLRQYINDNNLDVDIEMDGGIKLDNVEEVTKAGVNVIVAGTGVFRGSLKENVDGFKSIFSKQ